MTTEFLQGALNWADLRYPIKHMRTPKRAARKYAIQMNELRTLARSTASEKDRVQGLIEEAILRLQESKVMILARNFLVYPTIETNPTPRPPLQLVALLTGVILLQKCSNPPKTPKRKPREI